MSYSKYSPYSREQIVTDEYEKICKIFFKMAKDDKTREILNGILYDGGYSDFSVNSEEMNKSNPYVEASKRISYANLLVTHPETFKLIMDNNITVFHGTNSNALPSIIKHGMGSVDSLKEDGIEVLTGERWSRVRGKRNFISLTDNLDIASEYGSIGTSKDSVFGVIVGLKSESLRKQKKCVVHSDVPEIGVSDRIPRQYIDFIGVPEDKVDFVKRIIDDDKVIVAPMEITERFYYVNDVGGIYIDDDKVDKVLNGTKLSKKIAFKVADIKQLVQSRAKSGIRKIYDKIKGKSLNNTQSLENSEEVRE